MNELANRVQKLHTTDKVSVYYYNVDLDKFVNSDAWYEQNHKVDRITVDAHLTAQEIDVIFNEIYN